MSALHRLELEPGGSASVRVRLTSASARAVAKSTAKPLGAGFDRVFKARREEADEFYATLIDAWLGEDAGNVMRQALAGMLWGKQYYEYDVHKWLRKHGVNPWSVHAQNAGVRKACVIGGWRPVRRSGGSGAWCAPRKRSRARARGR